MVFMSERITFHPIFLLSSHLSGMTPVFWAQHNQPHRHKNSKFPESSMTQQACMHIRGLAASPPPKERLNPPCRKWRLNCVITRGRCVKLIYYLTKNYLFRSTLIISDKVRLLCYRLRRPVGMEWYGMAFLGLRRWWNEVCLGAEA